MFWKNGLTFNSSSYNYCLYLNKMLQFLDTEAVFCKKGKKQFLLFITVKVDKSQIAKQNKVFIHWTKKLKARFNSFSY